MNGQQTNLLCFDKSDLLYFLVWMIELTAACIGLQHESNLKPTPPYSRGGHTHSAPEVSEPKEHSFPYHNCVSLTRVSSLELRLTHIQSLTRLKH